MGLDVSHDCWSGAYSAFNRWRGQIASAVDIPLELMEGFFRWSQVSTEDVEKLATPNNRDGSFAEWSFDLARAARGNLPISWGVLKPSPLHILLNHSDCDGEIAWGDCNQIADELEKIIPLLPSGEGGGHIGNWRDKTDRFIKGLRLAAEAKENVEFF